ncbi:MAG: VWA domain-containing protein [Streptosporangiaceae bacterium]
MPGTTVSTVLTVMLMAGAVACSSSPTPGGKEDCAALNLVVAPELAPALQAVASSGECKVNVIPRSAAKIADILAGTLKDPSTPTADAWIPDSSLWIAQARRTAAGAALVPGRGRSLATSPIVFGVPAPLAVQLAKSGRKVSWLDLLPADMSAVQAALQGPTMAIPDPGVDSAGLITLLAAQQLAGKGKPGLQRFATATMTVRTLAVKSVPKAMAATRPTIGIMSEQAVLASKGKIIAANPVEGTLSLDYPFLVTTGDPGKAAAARTLGAALVGTDFTRLGFRTASGEPPAGLSPRTGVDLKGPKKLSPADPEMTLKIRKMWNRVQLGARMLNVLDVSPSMSQLVPGTDITRIKALTAQIQKSFALTPPFVSMGLWEFSTRVDGAKHYRQILPIRPVSGRHRADLIRRLGGAKPIPGTYTGLYDTVLAAYREVSRVYQPDVYNSVLVFTDGINQNPYGGLTLNDLITQLKKLYDPKEPVSVVIGAYGPDIKEAPLKRIAAATNGGVYVSRDAEQTQRIFQDLLVKMICDGADCPVS